MSLFTTDIKQDPISKLNLHFYTELCKHNNSTSRADNTPLNHLILTYLTHFDTTHFFYRYYNININYIRPNTKKHYPRTTVLDQMSTPPL